MTTQNEALRSDILRAIVNCPHKIVAHQLNLGFSTEQPGQTALAQLADRIESMPEPRRLQAENEELRKDIELAVLCLSQGDSWRARRVLDTAITKSKGGV